MHYYPRTVTRYPRTIKPEEYYLFFSGLISSTDSNSYYRYIPALRRRDFTRPIQLDKDYIVQWQHENSPSYLTWPDSPDLKAWSLSSRPISGQRVLDEIGNEKYQQHRVWRFIPVTRKPRQKEEEGLHYYPRTVTRYPRIK